MNSKELGKKALACIDLVALSDILIKDVIFTSLKKVVDDSENKFDDAAYAMLAPLLEAEARKQLNKLIADLKA